MFEPIQLEPRLRTTTAANTQTQAFKRASLRGRKALYTKAIAGEVQKWKIKRGLEGRKKISGPMVWFITESHNNSFLALWLCSHDISFPAPQFCLSCDSSIIAVDSKLLASRFCSSNSIVVLRFPRPLILIFIRFRFFLVQALHGIKPSRVKSKARWLKNCPWNKTYSYVSLVRSEQGIRLEVFGHFRLPSLDFCWRFFLRPGTTVPLTKMGPEKF